MNPNSKLDLSTFSPGERKSTGRLRQTPELQTGSNILIIGAGAFGGWTALNLLRLGYKVTLADSWGPGNSRASSGGETRLIRAIYGCNEKYFNMTMEAWEGWREMENLSGQKLLHNTGVSWFFHKGGEDLRKAIARIMDERIWPYEFIAGEDIISRFPAINSDGLEGILIEKNAGYLQARVACRVVKDQFEKEGGTYVQTWIPGGSPENILKGFSINGQHIKFEACVYACGPWLPRLFPELLEKKLVISRQEVHYFGIPRDKEAVFTGFTPFIDWDPDSIYYGIPLNDHRGFKIACDVRGEVADPTNMDRSPDPVLVEKSRRYLARRFPLMSEAPLIESRVCQYTNSPDGNFLLDQHPESDYVWILGAGSGHGFKHGPAIGKLAASIISGRKPIDPDFVIPD